MYPAAVAFVADDRKLGTAAHAGDDDPDAEYPVVSERLHVTVVIHLQGSRTESVYGSTDRSSTHPKSLAVV